MVKSKGEDGGGGRMPCMLFGVEALVEGCVPQECLVMVCNNG